MKDAIDDQQELKDDTFELDESENPNSDELSQQQADLVDRTDFIRQDVAELVPNAAQALGLSTDSQQEARAALSTPPPTLPPPLRNKQALWKVLVMLRPLGGCLRSLR